MISFPSNIKFKVQKDSVQTHQVQFKNKIVAAVNQFNEDETKILTAVQEEGFFSIWLSCFQRK